MSQEMLEGNILRMTSEGKEDFAHSRSCRQRSGFQTESRRNERKAAPTPSPVKPFEVKSSEIKCVAGTVNPAGVGGGGGRK